MSAFDQFKTGAGKIVDAGRQLLTAGFKGKVDAEKGRWKGRFDAAADLAKDALSIKDTDNPAQFFLSLFGKAAKKVVESDVDAKIHPVVEVAKAVPDAAFTAIGGLGNIGMGLVNAVMPARGGLSSPPTPGKGAPKANEITHT